MTDLHLVFFLSHLLECSRLGPHRFARNESGKERFIVVFNSIRQFKAGWCLLPDNTVQDTAS
jgi:hypothetical protein